VTGTRNIRVRSALLAASVACLAFCLAACGEAAAAPGASPQSHHQSHHQRKELCVTVVRDSGQGKRGVLHGKQSTTCIRANKVPTGTSAVPAAPARAKKPASPRSSS